METATCFLSHDAVAKQDIYIVAVLSVFTGSIARSANLPVFSLLRGRF